VLDRCESSVVNYCTPAVTTNGCSALISGVGVPTASGSCPFSLKVAGVEGQKQGIIFYGVTGPLASPWGTGFLCVKAPTQRTGTQNSGGTVNGCDGTYALDFNLYMSTHPAAVGQPLFAGQTLYGQAWFRDPPSPKTTNMSDAVRFVLAP